MSCKILFFDFRPIEKHFFEINKLDNFDIKFLNWELNSATVDKLSAEDLDKTLMISVYKSSNVDGIVLSKFKNLRLISTRSEDFSHIDVKYCLGNNIAVINVECYVDPRSVENTLKVSFSGMTDFLCGGKSNRVV